MTGPDTVATVPDEADIVIPAEVLAIARKAAAPIYAALRDSAHLVGTDEERAGAIFLAAYMALAEAGWEFMHGPVETEWSNTYTDTGERWPRPDEAAARDCAADSYPAVAAEFRQVTAWRPAPESTQDGDSR